MTLEQKKAYAYDLLAQIQYLQTELQKVNVEIANFKEEPKGEEAKKEEAKTE